MPLLQILLLCDGAVPSPTVFLALAVAGTSSCTDRRSCMVELFHLLIEYLIFMVDFVRGYFGFRFVNYQPNHNQLAQQ